MAFRKNKFQYHFQGDIRTIIARIRIQCYKECQFITKIFKITRASMIINDC